MVTLRVECRPSLRRPSAHRAHAPGLLAALFLRSVGSLLGFVGALVGIVCAVLGLVGRFLSAIGIVFGRALRLGGAFFRDGRLGLFGIRRVAATSCDSGDQTQDRN